MGRHNDKIVITTSSQGSGGRRSYVQHDDRRNGGNKNKTWRKDGSDKHVSFEKRGGFIRKKKGGNHSGATKLGQILFEEGDEDMGGNPRNSDSNNRYQSGRSRAPRGALRGQRGGKRGRGGRGGHVYIAPGLLNQRGGRNLMGKSWHKVTIHNGTKYQKNELLSSLLSSSTAPFKPIAFSKLGPNFVFYVETKESALALRAVDRKLVMPDGANLGLKVESSSPPQMNMSDEVLEKIKIVMSSRYTPATKALDLKQFHADNAFLGEDVYAPLNRSTVLNNIIKIIGDNIPEIEAVDLSDNRIPTLDHFSTLATRAPNVKLLYLNDNRIYEVSELEKCKSWKLVELKLLGNPCVTKFKDTTSYHNAVRKIFPTLVRLDGKELTKLIKFDDDDDDETNNAGGFKLPQTIAKMACNDQAGSIVLQFLEQYLKVYDSDNRQSLMDAYHDEAVMSMSAAYPLNSSAHGSKKLEEYIMESRNLFRIQDSTRRYKLLRQGKLSIISFLNDLPKTSHDFNSITLDLPFATERLMTFTVTGLYKERKHDNPIRHFNRMFVVVPQGSGFVIINEFLFITNPTVLQLKKAFNNSPTPSTSTQQRDQSFDENTKKRLAMEVSQKTGMNLDWSAQCLGQTNWDLNASLVAFQKAKSEGKIPSEAFL